jgi:uncharacterized membrane protein
MMVGGHGLGRRWQRSFSLLLGYSVRSVLPLVVCVAGCGGPDTPTVHVDGRPGGVTSVYFCALEGGTNSETSRDTPAKAYDERMRLVTRLGDKGIAIWLPNELGGAYRYLPRVEAASGSRYAEDDLSFWSKGDDAMLDVGDLKLRGCERDSRQSIWEHAKLDGADFRAVGNEPGWVLEIREKTRLEFLYDYGQSSIVVMSSVLTQDGRTSHFTGSADGREVVVTLVAETCNDTMSDELFETRVTVRLDDREFRGCGRPLH